MLLMMIPTVLAIGWLASRGGRVESCGLTPSNETDVSTVNLAFKATLIICLALSVGGHWSKLTRLATEATVVQALVKRPQLPFGQANLLLDQHEDFLASIYEANYLLYQAYRSNHWAALLLPDHPAVSQWGEAHRKLTLEQLPKDRQTIAGLNLMGDYNWTENCKTTVKVSLPVLSFWDIFYRTEHDPLKLPEAQLLPVSSNCANADLFWTGR